jgi:precorrin-2/cobalt-factor-2 C20-methyltransferase
VLRYVQRLAPDIPVISVPGITSYQASAAFLNEPLVEGEESLLIVSGVHGGDCVRRFGTQPENLVFLKAYRNVGDIAAALDEIGVLGNSIAVKNCGLPDQEIISDIRGLEGLPPNYWTLIMAKNKRRHVPEVD